MNAAFLIFEITLRLSAASDLCCVVALFGGSGINMKELYHYCCMFTADFRPLVLLSVVFFSFSLLFAILCRQPAVAPSYTGELEISKEKPPRKAHAGWVLNFAATSRRENASPSVSRCTKEHGRKTSAPPPGCPLVCLWWPEQKSCCSAGGSKASRTTLAR